MPKYEITREKPVHMPMQEDPVIWLNIRCKNKYNKLIEVGNIGFLDFIRPIKDKKETIINICKTALKEYFKILNEKENKDG